MFKNGVFMSYVMLRKIFYSAPSTHESVYNDRFTSEYAHHLDFQIGDYPAFFVTTPEIHDLLIEIMKIDKLVYVVCNALPPIAKDQFSKRCLVDEIVLTNDIEGVHSTRREIGSLLSSLEQNDRHSRFLGLVQKYLLLQKDEDISIESCEDLRKIYDDLVLDEITLNDPDNLPDGEIFRKGLAIVTSATQKELHRGLYPEEKIISAMKQALSYLNNTNENLLYRIAVFHYLLGYIHPFYDGNGRLNRFISSYMLTKELHPLLSYRLSYTIKENINQYYSAFNDCNDPHNCGDLTPFVLMFLRIIRTSVSQLCDALGERLTQMRHYMELFYFLPQGNSEKMRALYNVLLQAELFSEDGISTKELMLYAECSRGTLMKRLELIQEAGLLKEKRVKNEKFYGLDLRKLDTYNKSL